MDSNNRSLDQMIKKAKLLLFDCRRVCYTF